MQDQPKLKDADPQKQRWSITLMRRGTHDQQPRAFPIGPLMERDIKEFLGVLAWSNFETQKMRGDESAADELSKWGHGERSQLDVEALGKVVGGWRTAGIELWFEAVPIEPN